MVAPHGDSVTSEFVPKDKFYPGSAPVRVSNLTPDDEDLIKTRLSSILDHVYVKKDWAEQFNEVRTLTKCIFSSDDVIKIKITH